MAALGTQAVSISPLSPAKPTRRCPCRGYHAACGVNWLHTPCHCAVQNSPEYCQSLRESHRERVSPRPYKAMAHGAEFTSKRPNVVGVAHGSSTSGQDHLRRFQSLLSKGNARPRRHSSSTPLLAPRVAPRAHPSANGPPFVPPGHRQELSPLAVDRRLLTPKATASRTALTPLRPLLVAAFQPETGVKSCFSGTWRRHRAASNGRMSSSSVQRLRVQRHTSFKRPDSPRAQPEIQKPLEP